jgi:hypothetical protein
MKKHLKTKTHAFLNKIVGQWVFDGPRLLEWIKCNKWKNIVAIDEAWVHMSHVNGRWKMYHESK